jgi:hypothetical protein
VKKKTTETIVFLLDNDTAQADYVAEIRRTVSPQTAQHYWEIFQNLTKELGYADYLGALQQYRLQDRHDPKLLSVASYLLDYDFTAQLYPQAMEVIAYLHKQGDVIFQPRKIVHAGLGDAVAGKVLICIHQEIHQVERRFPAQHYVIVDDKLRLLAAIKQHWRKRVTIVFVR